MSIMSNAKRALAIAAAAATLLSMAACGSSNAASGKSDSSGAASSGKIEVVASINQWGSVAEDLGGSNVEVTNIMTKTNVEAHDYEPTSQDVAKFGTAKVVFALRHCSGHYSDVERCLFCRSHCRCAEA